MLTNALSDDESIFGFGLFIYRVSLLRILNPRQDTIGPSGQFKSRNGTHCVFLILHHKNYVLFCVLSYTNQIIRSLN